MRASEDTEPLGQPIDAHTARGARAFIREVEGRYAVAYCLLFGSRARGTHTDESDADIAVVLEGAPLNRTIVARTMAGISFDVMQRTGILVEALPLWSKDLEHPDTFSNPTLIRHIQRDGRRL